LWFSPLGIRLGVEVKMGRKSDKKRGRKKPVDRETESSKVVEKLAAMIAREVSARLGPDATYEQRRDAAAGLMTEALWKDEDNDLQKAVTDDDEVEVGDKRYRRMDQPSSATYYGRWGPHEIEEPLYREVGVHNGPTIKPIELRVGIVARRMTPDLARIVGELSADHNSRAVEKTMRTVGLVPPGRAFIEKRVKQMAGEIVERVDALEHASRAATSVPKGVASVSCGLDRFSVRMCELLVGKAAEAFRRRPRTEPYQRTPPPPKEYHFRKAWVGSVTVYDDDGDELHTWRYAAEANADPRRIAARVAADVAWVLRSYPDVPVHSVQDAAPELRVLLDELACALPAGVKVRDLIDFEHLMGYLDDVVDACEPEGDPHNMKSWYRGQLLHDDHAIERIWRGLRERSRRLPGRSTKARDAVAAAISYIRDRKDKMRYASLYAAKLPIGSGATESTCWTMQQRVKRPAQSWQVPGLRGTLTIRALVLSDRWESAWQPYAAAHRKEVRCVT
jgi:hypothetical protein